MATPIDSINKATADAQAVSVATLVAQTSLASTNSATQVGAGVAQASTESAKGVSNAIVQGAKAN